MAARRTSSFRHPSHEPPSPRFATQQERGRPLLIYGWIVEVAEAYIAHAAAAADLDRAGRSVDGRHGKTTVLEVQSGASRARAEVEYRTPIDHPQQLPLPPRPLVEAPEERMHRRSYFSGVDFEVRCRHLSAAGVIQEGVPPRVAYVEGNVVHVDSHTYWNRPRTMGS